MSEYNIGVKIKRLRHDRGLTLQDMSKEIGFSPALICQIENNHISPPIATLSRIAQFFDVKIGTFFAESDDEERLEVVRAEERIPVPKVVSQDGTSHGYTYEALSARKFPKKMEPFLLTVTERATDQHRYSHTGEEFLLVLEGTAELLVGDHSVTLNKGDSVYFDSSLRHRLLSRHGGEVKVMVMVTR